MLMFFVLVVTDESLVLANTLMRVVSCDGILLLGLLSPTSRLEVI